MVVTQGEMSQITVPCLSEQCKCLDPQKQTF